MEIKKLYDEFISIIKRNEYNSGMLTKKEVDCLLEIMQGGKY